jgi:hypothetical protein
VRTIFVLGARIAFIVCAVLFFGSSEASRSHRSDRGRFRRSSSPSARRSKATNDDGVSLASRFTRDSAGWIRCWRTSKSSTPPETTTISPSRTARFGRAAASPSSSSGK